MKCKTCEEFEAVVKGDCYQCHFEKHQDDEPTAEERKQQAIEHKQDVEKRK